MMKTREQLIEDLLRICRIMDQYHGHSGYRAENQITAIKVLTNFIDGHPQDEYLASLIERGLSAPW